MAERSVFLLVISIFFIHIYGVFSAGVTDQPRAAGDVYCWHTSDTSPAMNQSCSTGKSHPPHMVSSTNGTEQKVDNSTGNATTLANGTQVMRCVTYKTYINDTTLRYPARTVVTAVDISRSCDFDGLCDGHTLNHNFSTVINGSHVVLVCCEGNNCNEPGPSTVPTPAPSTVPTPATNKTHCYELTMEGTDMKLQGCQTVCPGEGMMCVKKTLHLKGGIVTSMYHCDYDNSCANITESELSCKNSSTGTNNTIETCCCKGDYCVKPDQPFEPPTEKDANSACSVVPINSTNHHPPGVPSPKKKVDWLFVGGLIASVAVAILLALAVVIVIMRVKRRAKQNNRLTLSYTRLAADRVPDDDEDVQMLLS